jgi:hypothetical protein
VKSLAVSPDGTTLASGGDEVDTRLLIWDLAARKRKAVLGGHDHNVPCLAFAPDGKVLVSGDGVVGSDDKGGVIRFWDPATGDKLREIKAHKNVVHSVAFSPDGKRLASAGGDNVARLWDPVTAKELRQFPGGGDPLHVRKPDHFDVAFSPDGKELLTASSLGEFIIWEAETGVKRHNLGRDAPEYRFACFRPDGKALVGQPGPGGGALRQLDRGFAFGKLFRTAGRPSGFVLSSDGRTLAVRGGRGDPVVYVWDLPTALPILEFKGHHGGVESLAFAPDGKTLFSGGTDGTILLWDLSELSRKRSEAFWSLLSRTNEKDAAEVIAALVSVPTEAVALLQVRTRPMPEDPRVARLIADLDADEFAVRERASHELEKLGADAEAALVRALASEPSTEVRTRIEKLLAKRGDPEQLRGAERRAMLRAVRVLEAVGTDEAQAVLRTLGQGEDAAPVTREARTALERLLKRGPRRP